MELAGLHAKIRGYGPVKLANLSAIKKREQVLARQLGIDAATAPVVQRALAEAGASGGTLKGIPVVTVR